MSAGDEEWSQAEDTSYKAIRSPFDVSCRHCSCHLVANIEKSRSLQNEEVEEDPTCTMKVRKFRLFVAYLLWLITLPFSLFASFIVTRNNERALFWRFGQLTSNKFYGPGIVFFNPFCDRIHFIDVRDDYIIMERQKYFTRDWIAVSTSLIIFLETVNPRRALFTSRDNGFVHVTAATVLGRRIRSLSLEDFWRDTENVLDHTKNVINGKLESIGVRVRRICFSNLEIPDALLEVLTELAIERRKAAVKEAAARSVLKALECISQNGGETGDKTASKYYMDLFQSNAKTGVDRQTSEH